MIEQVKVTRLGQPLNNRELGYQIMIIHDMKTYMFTTLAQDLHMYIAFLVGVTYHSYLVQPLHVEAYIHRVMHFTVLPGHGPEWPV